MRLYELLNPGQTQQPAIGNPVAAVIQPTMQSAPPTPASPAIGKEANWLTDFLSTPHPIGSSAGPPPPASPAPGTNAAGQPAFVDRAVNSTFIGDINRGLAAPPKP